MKKTSISIVGSGNVATHLGLAFHAAGCTVKQVLSRSLDHAQTLARRVGAHPICDWHRLEEDADVYILAVGDDALYDLALDLRLPNALVVHTSGATPLSVLRPVSRRRGVLWSPQTFVRDIAMDYRRLPLCIEGSTPEVESDMEELARLISPCIYRLDYEQRRRAHLAAVMVSNFVNAVNATAHDYLNANGLDPEMLRPLAEQTLAKWDYGQLWLQQTGPAVRRDDKTLDAQRRLLAEQPELLKLYELMTDIIMHHT